MDPSELHRPHSAPDGRSSGNDLFASNSTSKYPSERQVHTTNFFRFSSFGGRHHSPHHGEVHRSSHRQWSGTPRKSEWEQVVDEEGNIFRLNREERLLAQEVRLGYDSY